MHIVYLVRHGQKYNHAGDPRLTSIGRKQAKETGDYFKENPIQKIVSSPFKRTAETAEIIGNKTGLEHELNDSLVERMNWNSEHIDRDDFISEWSKSTHDRTYIPKYGDSSLDTGGRIKETIAEVLDSDKYILLVTHGGAIADFLRNIFGDEKLTDLVFTYPDGFDYQINNCSITKLIYDGGDVTLELLDFTGHLTKVTM